MLNSDSLGRLKKKEVLQALQLLNQNPTDKEVETLFDMIDLDGGGDIDLQEFTEMMTMKLKNTALED